MYARCILSGSIQLWAHIGACAYVNTHLSIISGQREQISSNTRKNKGPSTPIPLSLITAICFVRPFLLFFDYTAKHFFRPTLTRLASIDRHGYKRLDRLATRHKRRFNFSLPFFFRCVFWTKYRKGEDLVAAGAAHHSHPRLFFLFIIEQTIGQNRKVRVPLLLLNG